MVIVVVTGIAITTTVANSLPAGKPPPSNDKLQPGTLLTTNRDRLAICIQPVASVQFDMTEAQLRVQAALTELSTHPRWAEIGLAGRAPVVVDAGCPSEAYLLRSGTVVDPRKPTGDPVIQGVAEASKYRVFLFVPPESETARLFSVTASMRRAPQEYLCQGNSCFEVTTALYLSFSEVRNHQFLTEWLAKVIGLESSVPPQKPGPPPQR